MTDCIILYYSLLSSKTTCCFFALNVTVYPSEYCPLREGPWEVVLLIRKCVWEIFLNTVGLAFSQGPNSTEPFGMGDACFAAQAAICLLRSPGTGSGDGGSFRAELCVYCKGMTSTLCFLVTAIGLGCGYSRPFRGHWPLLSSRICAAIWEMNVSQGFALRWCGGLLAVTPLPFRRQSISPRKDQNFQFTKQ